MSLSTFARELPIDRFASTGDTKGEVFHLWDLASANPSNYENIFMKSVVPRIEDFRGKKFNGLVLYVKNIKIGSMVFTAYTGKLRDEFNGKMHSRSLTFQKRFF